MSEERTVYAEEVTDILTVYLPHARKEFFEQLAEAFCLGCGFDRVEESDVQCTCVGFGRPANIIKAYEQAESSLAAANERIDQLERMVKHEACDWSECDDAMEKAGVVMNHDGYRKTHVEAVEELGARIAKLEGAAEFALGDWTNVKARDVLRQALTPKE